jgi:C-terminal processing protease CtpA/Prc
MAATTHSWLILEPNEGFSAAFEWDMSGILLNTVGSDFSRYEISGVLERSPGAEAGIREGDTLIAIDGTPVVKLGLSKIEGLFKQEGREFRLEIQRNKQNFEIRLKTRRLV